MQSNHQIKYDGSNAYRIIFFAMVLDGTISTAVASPIFWGWRPAVNARQHRNSRRTFFPAARPTL